MMCRSSCRSRFPQETVRPRLGTCARRRPSVHAKDTLERRQGSGQNAKTESSACETGTPLGSVFGSHGHGRAATGDKEGKKKTRAPKKRSGSTSRGPVKKIEREIVVVKTHPRFSFGYPIDSSSWLGRSAQPGSKKQNRAKKNRRMTESPGVPYLTEQGKTSLLVGAYGSLFIRAPSYIQTPFCVCVCEWPL